MELRGSRSNIIIGLLTLVLLGFLLFVSVYNQIIVQNEGFFYMIAFGGILILVYILIGLMIKLVAISPQVEDMILWNALEALAYIGIVFVFVYIRIKYVSSSDPNEELFYKMATFLNDDTLPDSLDIVTKLVNNPDTFLYGLCLSPVFRLFDNSISVIIYFNCAIIALSGIFIGRCARAVGGRVCGIVALLLALFIPSQSFAVYSFDCEIIVSLFLFITLDLCLCISNHYFKYTIFSVLVCVLFGVVSGITLFSEPLMIIPFVILSFFMIFAKTHNIHEILISDLSAIFSLVIFEFIKSSILDVPFIDVFAGFFSRYKYGYSDETGMISSFSEVFAEFIRKINNQSIYITESFYYLTGKNGETISDVKAAWLQLGTQLIFMFILVLSIGCACYLIRLKNPKVIPCYIMLLGSVYILFARAINNGHTFYFFNILIVCGVSSLNYMYENHHPELVAAEPEYEEVYEEEIEEETISQEEYERQINYAEALVFIGENEELYQKIKEDEKLRALNLPRPEAENSKNEFFNNDTFNSFHNDNNEMPEDADTLDKFEEYDASSVTILDSPEDIDMNKNSLDAEENIEMVLDGKPLATPTPLPAKAKPRPMEFDDELEEDFVKNKPANKASRKDAKKVNKKESKSLFKNNSTKHLEGIDASKASKGSTIILSDEYFDFDINNDDDDFDDFDV